MTVTVTRMECLLCSMFKPGGDYDQIQRLGDDYEQMKQQVRLNLKQAVTFTR